MAPFQILQARNTPYFPILHLAAYTGLRRGELLGHRWSDIDLDMGTLKVRRALYVLRNGGVTFQEPKTAKARRLIALSPAAVLNLKSHRQCQEALLAELGRPWDEDRMVFCNIDGGPILPNTVTLDTYSHVLPGLQEAAALKFDSALGGRRAATKLLAKRKSRKDNDLLRKLGGRVSCGESVVPLPGLEPGRTV